MAGRFTTKRTKHTKRNHFATLAALAVSQDWNPIRFTAKHAKIAKPGSAWALCSS